MKAIDIERRWMKLADGYRHGGVSVRVGRYELFVAVTRFGDEWRSLFKAKERADKGGTKR